jgi:hypothetical protein
MAWHFACSSPADSPLPSALSIGMMDSATSFFCCSDMIAQYLELGVAVGSVCNEITNYRTSSSSQNKKTVRHVMNILSEMQLVFLVFDHEPLMSLYLDTDWLEACTDGCM